LPITIDTVGAGEDCCLVWHLFRDRLLVA